MSYLDMSYPDMNYPDDLPGADSKPSKINRAVFFIC